MKLLPDDPPPGPTRPDFWRSPLRGRWLTTVLGTFLLGGIVIVAVTGFLSHVAYQPGLGNNELVPGAPTFGLSWPTSPSWLYAVTQGLHVTVGIAVVPLLLAKLWSVIPRLFSWPPVSSPAEALTKLTTLLLVGGAIFMFVTGIFNAQLFYPWRFNFVVAHYWGAWVFLAALALHLGLQAPIIRRAYATRGAVLDAAADDDHLRAPDPDPPSISRRGLFGLVAAASGALLITTAGQSIGGPTRQFALFAPRGRGASFPVNKTAAVARVTPEMVGPAWRLELFSGDRMASFTREDLLAMQQHTYDLPIACVEGWSTTQTWTGVRLRDLAALAGLPDADEMLASSLQPRGAFRQATIDRAQVQDERSLLALRVNGDDLPIDHGFPARIIVPALPGVHCTKWVRGLRFS